jgi:superfamily II DNA or RNA helicase
LTTQLQSSGTVRMVLSPDSLDDYRKFLRIKSLPQYRFVGRTAEFPAEYADRVGCDAPERPHAAYEPLSGLFDYQRDITALAIRKRKFAAFVRPGLGKTLMESEFARHAATQIRPDQKVLMVAPSMVVPQTLEEIERFYGWRMSVQHIRASQLSDWLTSPDGSRIGITNYEALKAETPQGRLGALIIDESSILKSAYSTWGQIILRLGRGLEWKFAGTGTPAPNDRIEYANHAVFLDHYPTVNSFLARFFVNRGETQNRWELKPHALRPFYLALSHWCIFLTRPGAYGWKDNSKPLPPIHIHTHDVPLTTEQQEIASANTGSLFGMAKGIVSRGMLGQIAKGHYKGRDIPTNKPEFVRNLIAGWSDKESTLVWCLYNREQDTLEKVMPNAASMRGETKYEVRAKMIADFKAGRVRTLISKPDILGFGLNLQVATRQVFSGIQDSYEDFFQCLMRSNRVGSKYPLNAHLPVTHIERPMLETVLHKAKRVEEDATEQESIFIENELAKGVVNAAA